ncbi:hypothetical protein LCGC14_3072340, partial [marine sediment metagenome]
MVDDKKIREEFEAIHERFEKFDEKINLTDEVNNSQQNRFQEIDNKIAELKKYSRVIEQLKKDNTYDKSPIKDFDDLRQRYMRNMTYCIFMIEELEKELSELKNVFDCHFRADKDYDLRYSGQIKELKEIIDDVALQSSENREVLRETFERIKKGERITNIFALHQLKKLGGEKYGVTLSKEKSRKELRET